MSSLKILHTADVHLDAPYRFLGTSGSSQRQVVRETFDRVCRLAYDDSYHLLLIAGDLFDSNSVSDKTLDWIITLLGDIGIPVCISPGTHDCLGAQCIYRNMRVRWPSNVRLALDAGPLVVALPDLDLSIHTNVGSSPIDGLKRSGSIRWEIAMAHGSVIIPGKIDSAESPITSEQIAATGLDYIALGHWHSWGDYSAGDVKAIYPGSPERIEFGTGKGAIASVTLTENGTIVERKVVGARRMEEKSISVAGMKTAEDLRREVAALADPDLALRLTLTGLSSMEFTIDTSALREELCGEFFWLEILDRSHPSLAELSDELFPDRLVIGKYARQMAKQIEQSAGDEDAVSLLEDALQVGVAVLQGRKVF